MTHDSRLKTSAISRPSIDTTTLRSTASRQHDRAIRRTLGESRRTKEERRTGSRHRHAALGTGPGCECHARIVLSLGPTITVWPGSRAGQRQFGAGVQAHRCAPRRADGGHHAGAFLSHGGCIADCSEMRERDGGEQHDDRTRATSIAAMSSMRAKP